MVLKRILNSKSEEFGLIWKIYLDSFPSSERRNRERQAELFEDGRYRLFAIFAEKNAVGGFISAWNFRDFIFIEHFAIKKELRNTGLGSYAIKKYISGRKNKKIVLEIEKPKTDIAKKRIKFYRVLGFKLNSYDYVQPAYGKNKKPVKLCLMTYPGKIAKSDFNRIKKEVYSAVYSVNIG